MRITVIVDCNECAVRGPACRDCVITVLLGLPDPAEAGVTTRLDAAPRVRLNPEERAAMAVLAEVGLVPRLRLVQTSGSGDGGPCRDDDAVCDPRRTG